MKLLYLHLRPYGCLTDTRLNFGEDARGMNVIYGDNEVGKSTALRALTGLLYGIPPRTRDVFLHAPKDLRIAAELQRSDGERLTIIRRKGNKNTLLDMDERPIPESMLTPYLAGVTEEIFRTMYRLNHAEVLKGADDLLLGKGDIAESLFEAGTGIAKLRTAIETLETEGGSLFKKNSGTAFINKAIKTYEEARKKCQELSVPPHQFVEQSKLLKKKEKELDSIVERLRHFRSEKERLNRFELALSYVTKRSTIVSELEQLGEFALLEESITREREEAQRKLQDVSTRKGEVEEKLHELDLAQSQLIISQEVLEQATLISSIYSRLDSYGNAQRDLPKVQSQIQLLENDVRAILKEIYPDLCIEEVARLRLTLMQRNEIQRLAAESGRLQERQQNVNDRALTIASELEQQTRVFEGLPLPRDTEKLQHAVERAQQDGNIETALGKENDQVAKLEKRALGELKRLGIWSGKRLEELDELLVPSVETVERFVDVFDDLAQREQLNERLTADTREEEASLEQQIQALRLSGGVPTEIELQQARDHRDSGWQLVRQAWLEGLADEDAHRKFDPDRPLPDAFEQSVSEADAIGDRLRREAARVANLAKMLADQEGCRRRLKELGQEREQLISESTDVRKEWEETWAPANINPLPPKEMGSWLNQLSKLIAQWNEILAHRQTTVSLQGRINQHIQDLNHALDELNEPICGPTEKLLALLQRSQSFIENMGNERQQRESGEKDVARLTRDSNKIQDEQAQVKKQLEVWREQWNAATKPLGLRQSLTSTAALAVLEKHDLMFKKLEDSNNNRIRVQEMQEYILSFENDIEALGRTVATEFADMPPDQKAYKLHALLEQAQQDLVRRQEIEKQIEQKKEEFEKCDQDIKAATKILNGIRQKAGCTELSGVELAERKSAEFRKLKQALEEVNETISGFASGMSVEQLVEEVMELDPDLLKVQLQELDELIQDADQQRSSLEQQIGGERNKLEAIDGSDQAAAAGEEAESALGDVRAGTEHYLRLRLTCGIMHRFIDHFREQNQGPVLQRASQLFPRLTCGSFESIKAGFDEKDNPILIGIRADGEEVGVEGMSDGTRDQLYIALRLASLENRLEINEPLPLVVDDILVNFDDKRALATLGVLAELCEKTQVLFFTHHSRLVELAHRAVPEESLEISELNSLAETG